MFNKMLSPLLKSSVVTSLWLCFWTPTILADTCPRIVSQSPYITLQLDFLGLKDCIVGASRYDKALGVADTGGVLDPNASAIEALNPDLWLTSDWTADSKFKAIAPHSKQALRLESFAQVAQIEQNLTQIAKAINNRNLFNKINNFSQRLKQRISQINGQNRRVLLISSCSGQPYAFGQEAYLTDLFDQMGFQTIKPEKRITHLPITAKENKLETLIGQTQPDLVFIFERQLAPACQIMALPQNTQIIPLNGKDFLQPAPVILQALDQLSEFRKQHD